MVLALAGMNGPWVYHFSTEKYHEYTINKPEYKAKNGRWDIIQFPEEYRQNTIHAALLHTGKILLIAGSGNNQDNLSAKKFDTRIWDPVKGTIKKIPTPADLFCTGRTQLRQRQSADRQQRGAGSTLKGDVTKAGGLMVVHNENPDKPITLPAGTRFTGKENRQDVRLQDRCSSRARRRSSTRRPAGSCATTRASAVSTSRHSRAARSTRRAPRTTTASRA